jgi:hypothetical protein
MKNNHYKDTAKWISDIISSCEKYQQTFVAHKLIDNFESRMGKMGMDLKLRNKVISDLKLELKLKRISL